MAWTNAIVSDGDSVSGTSDTTIQDGGADLVIETNARELVAVQIEADFPTTPTDDLEYKVYSSVDNTNYDTTPVLSGTIGNGTDPARVSFSLIGQQYYKFAAAATGSTDTITVTVRAKTDGVSA